MPVIRGNKITDYTIVSCIPLHNSGLSLNVIGLFVLIKSLPDSWKFSVEGFATIVKDGISSVRTALKELENFGYVNRERIRENGKYGKSKYVLNENVLDISKGFSALNNHHIHNKGLSLGASGLLSVMLSLPDDWKFSVKGLAKIRKEGTYAIRKFLNELVRAGYLSIEQSRKRGRFDRSKYIIRELPANLEHDIEMTTDCRNPVENCEYETSKSSTAECHYDTAAFCMEVDNLSDDKPSFEFQDPGDDKTDDLLNVEVTENPISSNDVNDAACEEDCGNLPDDELPFDVSDLDYYNDKNDSLKTIGYVESYSLTAGMTQAEYDELPDDELPFDVPDLTDDKGDWGNMADFKGIENHYSAKRKNVPAFEKINYIERIRKMINSKKDKSGKPSGKPNAPSDENSTTDYQTTEIPITVSPIAENSLTVNSTAENCTQLNTNISNNKEYSKKEKNILLLNKYIYQISNELSCKINVDFVKLVPDVETKLLIDTIKIIKYIFTGKHETWKINGVNTPNWWLENRLRRLTTEKVYQMLKRLSKVKDTIHNLNSYIISSLYNAGAMDNVFVDHTKRKVTIVA
ncbi:MAG: hypothetical protein Q4G33_06535 [bacterium]|nr:hypothetical protein [bacterium]